MINQLSEDAPLAKPEGSDPTIQLVDLANALRIIDVAAQRGAFQGSELSQVGAVRDKISAFLNAIAPKDGEAK